MPDTKTRLRHVELKLERAKEHAATLNKAVRIFFDNNPYKVGTKYHPESGHLIYFVTDVQATPDKLSLLAGDAIQNLSTALDHLAYQVVCKDTNDAPPNPRCIYFPIADDQRIYDDKKCMKLSGAKAESIACFDAIKPYRGGNDSLWRLARLNNIEKHRLLLTVGSQARSINIGQIMSGLVSATFPPSATATIERMGHFLNLADKGFPLQSGKELYIGKVGELPNPRQQFRFELVLNESGVAEGLNIVDTIGTFVAEVERVIQELTPLIV